MKIHILYNLRNEPWGGGNQFLNALRDEWTRQGIYADTPEQADAVLFNSYPFGAEYLFNQAFRLKKQSPQKLWVYRLNGPISFIRNTDREIDQAIGLFNRALCDGIIFQSRWCQSANHANFGTQSSHETVIYNAPDTDIFNRHNRKPLPRPNEKIHLIATSWSANWRKGFDVYNYLDEHLDFDRYEMTFIGNSPVTFKRIRMIPPVGSKEMAEYLKQHDIYITASQADPCSNALVEALCCGLPAVVRNDGGHPELIQKGGECFEDMKDVLDVLEKVSHNLDGYQNSLPRYDIQVAAREYAEFCRHLLDDVSNSRYETKKITIQSRLTFANLKGIIWKWKFNRAIQKGQKILWKH